MQKTQNITNTLSEKDESDDEIENLSKSKLSVRNSSSKSRSWSSLKDRYIKLWRTRMRDSKLSSGFKKSVVLVTSLSLISQTIIGFIGSLVSIYIILFYISKLSYDGEMDGFLSIHVGVLMTLPITIISLISLFSMMGSGEMVEMAPMLLLLNMAYIFFAVLGSYYFHLFGVDGRKNIPDKVYEL